MDLDTVSTMFEAYLNGLLGLAAVGVTFFCLDRALSSRSWGTSFGLLAVAFVVGGVGLNYSFRLPLNLVTQDLSGKTYVVTGCTPGGLGFETARRLLEWNAEQVVCTVRSAVRADELVAAMNGVVPKRKGVVQAVIMELANFESVRQGAKAIEAKLSKLDGLVLNAGLAVNAKRITVDGLEETYQVNHLSQYLLTRLLEKKLEASPSSRVVFVSSAAYFLMSYLDRDAYGKLPGGRYFRDGSLDSFSTYADSKLMNILTANEFARRHPDKRVIFNSVCPGIVKSGFQARMAGIQFFEIIDLFVALIARNTMEGSARILQALTYPEYVNTTGRFFDSYMPLPLNFQVTDDNAKWLWAKSAELTELTP